MPKKKKPERVDGKAMTATKRDFTRWWDLDEDSVAQGLEDRVRAIWEDDEPRRDEIERNLRRWGLSLAGLYADPSAKPRDALRVNLTKSLTETITAKVGKNRPRPKVLTDGGHYTNKMKAKKLQRFLDGVYQQADVYEKLPLWFRNAMLTGTGVLLPCGDPYQARFYLENVFPLEVLVDPAEGSAGLEAARNIYRLYPVDKDSLLEDYPHASVEIEAAGMYGPEATLPTHVALNMADREIRMVMVTEGWRRARYNREGALVPGRHVMTCNGAVLLDEEWEAEEHPFVFLHWTAPVRGPWGDSAVGEIRGMEKEVNILLQRAQEAMRRTGLATMLAHRDAKVQEQKTSNEPMAIFTYEGQAAPTVVTGTPVHPQILEQPQTLMRMAANQLGTNELQISASKPAGVESGRALEQLSEEHAVRFDTVSKAFEIGASKVLARHFVRVAKAMDTYLLAETGSGLRIQSTYKKEFIDLKWSEVELGPKEFFIDTFPVSVLPHLPAGRTAEVERWQNNKWMTPDEAKEALEFPDLESHASVSRASFELVEWQLEQMLDHGNDVAPDERQDLELARRYGTHAKLKAQRENYPAGHIALLEDYLTAIDEMLTPPAAPTTDPTMPGAEPMVPPAGGIPAPLPAEPMGPGLGATPASLPVAGQLAM